MMIVTQREVPASVRIPACPDRPARLGKESVQAFQSGFQQFTVQQSAIAAHGLGQVAGQALPDLRGRALIELQGFFQKMQRVGVHRGKARLSGFARAEDASAAAPSPTPVLISAPFIRKRLCSNG